ncbi:hypothetical protein O0I10_002456 [Lichtheimia ornata]|uniref:Beta-glucuronidase C-terminal domain-containing protein n=1 Tax=Lichtheimia ornata TaxID=688661 RepID=A0AAD7V9W9_9FUNG|nr:uncharacterized protein O0I10_002456 [Lichtheimia ornata]KAJ8661649.1 hypothetical protein O0I10_002456 [Lichtheimia ornata]
MKRNRLRFAATTTAALLFILNVPAQENDVVQLPSTASGISIPPYSHGIALEMGHWNNVFSTWNDKQSVTFLQLLRNLHDRRGALMIRLGGNSQDAVQLDESINTPVAKTGEQAVRTNSGATTYNIKVNSQMFRAMRQLSEVVGGLKWMFGLNFEHANDMQSAQQLGRLAVNILGGSTSNNSYDNVLYALQIGNEPDLYAKHGMRSPDWGVADYTGEWLDWAHQLSNEFGTSQYRPDLFSGGVVCCTWQLQDLLDSGYFDSAKHMLNSITVQRYSSNACFGVAKGTVNDYLSHDWITSLARDAYEKPIQRIVEEGKQVIMGETNTAACGGIQGISDTYVSTLWWVDWQLFLYSIGFSSIQLQLGGNNAHYNPMSKVGGSWVANPVYYGSLVTAEALGPSDSGARVVHVTSIEDQKVVYAIFHHDSLAYTVLINLDADNDASIPLQHPWKSKTLYAKRLVANSINERHDIHWAGQTLKGAVDGMFKGDIHIDSIECSDEENCAIHVPKASVALVGPHFPNITETSVVDNPYDIGELLNGTASSNSTTYNSNNPSSSSGKNNNPLHVPQSHATSSHHQMAYFVTAWMAILLAVVHHIVL